MSSILGYDKMKFFPPQSVFFIFCAALIFSFEKKQSVNLDIQKSELLALFHILEHTVKFQSPDKISLLLITTCWE